MKEGWNFISRSFLAFQMISCIASVVSFCIRKEVLCQCCFNLFFTHIANAKLVCSLQVVGITGDWQKGTSSFTHEIFALFPLFCQCLLPSSRKPEIQQSHVITQHAKNCPEVQAIFIIYNK